MESSRRDPNASVATNRVRLEEHSDDLGEARAMFEGTYGSAGWHAAPAERPFRYRHRAAGTDVVTFRTTTFFGDLTGAHESGDEYIVDWLKSGSGVLDQGRANLAVEHTPRLHPTSRAYAFTYRDFEQNLVHLDRRFVDDLAAGRDGTDPHPLVFDHTAVPSPDALGRWWSTLQYAAGHFLHPGDASPLLDAEVSRLVAVAFIELFPHERADQPDPTLNPRRARLRTAVDFVHANAHQPITTAEVARAADVSVRSLQQSFQRDVGMSPSDFIRAVRLDRVRATLLVADPAQVTVAEVARRWGFAHLGRFSGAYAERFGEYPRDTLRSS